MRSLIAAASAFAAMASVLNVEADAVVLCENTSDTLEDALDLVPRCLELPLVLLEPAPLCAELLPELIPE